MPVAGTRQFGGELVLETQAALVDAQMLEVGVDACYRLQPSRLTSLQCGRGTIVTIGPDGPKAGQPAMSQLTKSSNPRHGQPVDRSLKIPSSCWLSLPSSTR